MHIASIGIDLGKMTFHLVALDEHGKIVIKKKFSRKQLLAYTPTSAQHWLASKPAREHISSVLRFVTKATMCASFQRSS